MICRACNLAAIRRDVMQRRAECVFPYDRNYNDSRVIRAAWRTCHLTIYPTQSYALKLVKHCVSLHHHESNWGGLNLERAQPDSVSVVCRSPTTLIRHFCTLPASSVRMPASLNALTGLKPTHGRISLYGTLPFVPVLDSIGVLTRTAQDAALLIDVIAGPDYRDPATHNAPFCTLSAAVYGPRRSLRIAVMRQDEYPEPVTDDVQRATDDAVEVFRSLGNHIEFASLPLDFEELVRHQGLISAVEAYRVHAAYIEDMNLPFGAAIRKRIIRGKSINATDYVAALAHRRQTMERFHAWMQSYDLLLTPTLPFASFPVDQVDENSTSILSFVRPVSYLGSCAISLPSGFSEQGLPFGVQLIAGPWRDELLVQAGCAFQTVTNWHRRTPPGLQ